MARPRKGEEIGASTGVALRITPELRAQLNALARKHGRTITQELRAALEGHVERHDEWLTRGERAQECEAVRDAVS